MLYDLFPKYRYGRCQARTLEVWNIFVHQSYLFTNGCTSDYLKNNTKIFIKIAPTCFDVVTPSSGSALSVLAKVTLASTDNGSALSVLAKVTLASTDNALSEDGVTTPKHVGAILTKILLLFLRQSRVQSLVNK